MGEGWGILIGGRIQLVVELEIAGGIQPYLFTCFLYVLTIEHTHNMYIVESVCAK